MAGIITVTESTTGRTVYALIVNAAGNYYKGSGALEAYNNANRSTYAVAMTESPTNTYSAAFPADIVTAGAYSIYAFYQAAGAPALTDGYAAWGDMQWSGSAEIPPSSGGSGGGSLTLGMQISI